MPQTHMQFIIKLCNFCCTIALGLCNALRELCHKIFHSSSSVTAAFFSSKTHIERFSNEAKGEIFDSHTQLHPLFISIIFFVYFALCIIKLIVIYQKDELSTLNFYLVSTCVATCNGVQFCRQTFYF